jgi:non-ribosomal peptide synthetase component E (peptide arylation enzyme)
MLGPTAHTDTFARDKLPPPEQWPNLLLGGFEYPERLNAAVELTDRMVDRGFADHVALIGNGRRRTYKELADWTYRIADALTEEYGVAPGARVLIRSAHNPAIVACWLAATKAGAVVVNTMPMLRAGELKKIVDRAEISLALAFSSRLAHHRRRLRQESVERHAGRRLRWFAAARVHFRPWRSRGVSVQIWHRGDVAGERLAAEHDRDHPEI